MARGASASAPGLTMGRGREPKRNNDLVNPLMRIFLLRWNCLREDVNRESRSE